MTVTKTDLTNQLAAKKQYHKYAIKNAMDDIFDEIIECIKQDSKVTIRGFGTFEVKTRKSHPAVHPGTKEPIIVPEFQSVVFRPGEELIRAVRDKE